MNEPKAVRYARCEALADKCLRAGLTREEWTELERLVEEFADQYTPHYESIDGDISAGVRAVSSEADRLQSYAFRCRPPSWMPGMLPIGSEGIVEELLAYALRELLREYHEGASPEEVRKIAGDNLRSAIERHNKRSKDRCWGRWAEYGQDKLDWALGKLASPLRRQQD